MDEPGDGNQGVSVQTSWIEVDGEVLSSLRGSAGEGDASRCPNDALRELLQLGPAPEPCAPFDARRAAVGELLGEAAYERPILEALAASGGSARRAEVLPLVGAALADRLTERDLEPTKSGQVRWENRFGFARLRLVERGLVASGDKRGVWKLTEAGRTRLTALRAANP
jgi:hypothetical protein